MPRKLVPLSSEFPYHVTARCHNRDLFPVGLRSAWSIFEDYLFLCACEYSLRIHSFVMMPNHIHLLVSTPEANLGHAMQYFFRETSREFGRLSGTINQTWGSRYYKTLIGEWGYFMNAYKYVYRNPVRARISNDTVDYPFSTLAGICGRNPLRIPIAEDTLLFNPGFDDSILRWINRTPDPDDEAEIKNALRRPLFEYKPLKNLRRPSTLANRLY